MPDAETPYLTPTRNSHTPGYGMEALCPHCRRWTGMTSNNHPVRPGTLDLHATEKGPLCAASHTAITLKAAIARDNQLNPEEKTTLSRTFRHLTGCKGPLVDGDLCHHPACHQATAKGLRWTLEGWRNTTDQALF